MLGKLDLSCADVGKFSLCMWCLYGLIKCFMWTGNLLTWSPIPLITTSPTVRFKLQLGEPRNIHFTHVLYHSTTLLVTFLGINEYINLFFNCYDHIKINKCWAYMCCIFTVIFFTKNDVIGGSFFLFDNVLLPTFELILYYVYSCRCCVIDWTRSISKHWSQSRKRSSSQTVHPLPSSWDWRSLQTLESKNTTLPSSAWPRTSWKVWTHKNLSSIINP